MKATEEQREFIRNALTRQLGKLNLKLPAISTIRDCWILITRELIDIEEQRPLGYGTARDWKLSELNDSHIETVFRSILSTVGKTVA